jgi:hypothetical protein
MGAQAILIVAHEQSGSLSIRKRFRAGGTQVFHQCKRIAQRDAEQRAGDDSVVKATRVEVGQRLWVAAIQ